MNNIKEVIESLSKAVDSNDEYLLYTKISNAIPELRRIMQNMSGVNVGGVYISYYEQAKNDLVNDVFQYLDLYIRQNRAEDLKSYHLIVTHGAINNRLCIVTGGFNIKNAVPVDAVDNCSIFDVLQMNSKGFLTKEGYEKFQIIRKENPEYFLSYIGDFNKELDKFVKKEN